MNEEPVQLQAVCRGFSGGEVVWEVSQQDGSVLWSVRCIDFPWWRCVREAPPGMILEFGVRDGGSLRQIAEATGQEIYGFDWWKGLPHDDEGFIKGGCLAAKPDMPPHVVLIDGLFSDTLEGFLKDHDGPVGFVNLDCDLFTSSLYVLHCLGDRFVKGSIIALSDICHSPEGQRRAWLRFLKETGQSWEPVGKNHPWGEVYRLVDKTKL